MKELINKSLGELGLDFFLNYGKISPPPPAPVRMKVKIRPATSLAVVEHF